MKRTPLGLHGSAKRARMLRRRGTPVAVILAAGEGKRMGMPKAILEHRRGKTFLQVLASTFSSAGCRVMAVVGAGADEVRRYPTRAALVKNPGWPDGQFSSVRVGLSAALRLGAPVVLVHPVDLPGVRASTVRAVLAALAGHEGAVPELNGMPGHPLALTRAAAARVLAMAGAAHLEAAQRSLDIVRVPVRDAAVAVNLNTPEAYERALGFSPRSAPLKPRPE